MRGLPLIVGVMTVLIFAGMGLLVYGFAKKGAELGKGAAPAPASVTTPVTATFKLPDSITLPAGAAIQHMSGWKDGLALHVTAEDGEYIYLINGDGSMAGRTAIRRTSNAAEQP
jgi:hypothetical protein